MSIAPVTKRDVPVYLEGLGTVAAFYTVTVRSRVDGQLVAVSFREGQAVHRGDVLAQIDPRPFTIALHQAQAVLARDEALLQTNRSLLARDQQLRQNNLIAPQNYDTQAGIVGQNVATVQADRAAIENARLQLEYARITSPIDGVTGLRQVDPGNLVHASDATGLVVVTQLDPITVFFTLPEDDLPRIAAETQRGALTVDVFARDGTARLATGQLAVVDNQINAAAATIRLKAVFANGAHALWPNQFVKTRLLLAVNHAAMVIPTVAVQRGPNGTFVYVAGDDHRVSVRPIETGESVDEFVTVTRGLHEGEAVVTDGTSRLRPGARVSVRAPEHAGEARRGARP